MFDRIAGFFQRLGDSRSGEGALTADDVRVAAAALMYHVVDADGERREEERQKLVQAIAGTYGLKGSELAEVLTAGEEANSDAVDLYAFTRVILRDLDEAARLEFIELMWEVVYADGILHELEDNTVWRVAELIGVSNRDRVLLRRKVASSRGVALPSGSGETDD